MTSPARPAVARVAAEHLSQRRTREAGHAVAAAHRLVGEQIVHVVDAPGEGHRQLYPAVLHVPAHLCPDARRLVVAATAANRNQ